MKRIAITTLETYRKYLAGDEWTTQESLIQGLITPFQGNAYTRIGTAFHAIVEQGEAVIEELPEMGKFQVTVEGWPVIFNEAQIAMALKYRAKLPYAFHEEWIGREFDTPSMPIWVHGKVDVLHGTFIRDIKTKYSKVKYEDYAESAQWKLYLDLTGLDTFYFDLFEFPNYKIDKHGYDVSSLGIQPYGAIECIRYDGMVEENRQLVCDFTDFIVKHNLTKYLKDRAF
jgi:hypothetical protein